MIIPVTNSWHTLQNMQTISGNTNLLWNKCNCYHISTVSCKIWSFKKVETEIKIFK